MLLLLSCEQETSKTRLQGSDLEEENKIFGLKDQKKLNALKIMLFVNILAVLIKFPFYLKEYFLWNPLTFILAVLFFYVIYHFIDQMSLDRKIIKISVTSSMGCYTYFLNPKFPLKENATINIELPTCLQQLK